MTWVPRMLLPSFLEPLDPGWGLVAAWSPRLAGFLTETSLHWGPQGAAPGKETPWGPESRDYLSALGKNPPTQDRQGVGISQKTCWPIPRNGQRAEAGLCTPVRVWGRPRGWRPGVNRAATTGQQGPEAELMVLKLGAGLAEWTRILSITPGPESAEMRRAGPGEAPQPGAARGGCRP